MFLQTEVIPFEWRRVLMDDLPFGFLWEVAARSILMFIVIIVAMKITGRRGLKQLSAFELIFILALGSAAGDTLLYEDVAILPTLVVFTVIIGLYKLITHIISVSEKVEHFFEGEPYAIIKNGVFIYEDVEKEELALDEFFMELRNVNIEHLGQVRTAIFETNGTISLLYYSEAETIPGLPIFPGKLKEKVFLIPKEGKYACVYCGTVEDLKPSTAHQACSNCGHEEWVVAVDTKRIN